MEQSTLLPHECLCRILHDGLKSMCHTIAFLCFLGIVEAIECSDQISGDTTKTFEVNILVECVTFRTLVIEKSNESANRTSVRRLVIDGVVSHVGIVHCADQCFKCFDVVGGTSIKLNVTYMRLSLRFRKGLDYIFSCRALRKVSNSFLFS